MVVACLAVPETAAAATALDTRVDRDRREHRAVPAARCAGRARAWSPSPCSSRARRHVAGAAERRQGDWDVALFDADGRRVAAAARRTRRRSRTAGRSRRGTLTLQACRLLRRRRACRSTVTRTASPRPRSPRRAPTRRSSSRVNTPTRADKDRLVALGLDMTEHGGTDALGVVLHGAADRAALAQGRPHLRVLVKDLVAEERARAPPPPAVATDLPSGRTRPTARSPTTSPR